VNDTLGGWLEILVLVAALAVSFRPLGDYMAHVLTSERHWRVERLVYRAGGMDGDADQTWGVYLRSVLAFSALCVLFLYGFLRVQNHLLLAVGTPQMKADQASTQPRRSSRTRTGRPTQSSRRSAI